MMTETLFEYPCPACGLGVVQTTRIRSYKTKIKGYPFVVDEAIIGMCNHCQVRHFAPEETKRWEQLFSHTLAARKAFLSPEEITELRTTLSVSEIGEESYGIHPAVGTEVGMYATVSRDGELLAWFATYEPAVVECDADPAATAIAYVSVMIQDVEIIEEETKEE
jgi:hypothetical protein